MNKWNEQRVAVHYGSDGKEFACSAGDLGSIPGLGKSPGGGHATHSSILAWRIPTDRGAWQATVHGVTRSQKQQRLSTHTEVTHPGGIDIKGPTCNSGDPDSFPGLGRLPGGGDQNSLQYFSLENSMDRVWQSTAQGIAKSWTWLSD